MEELSSGGQEQNPGVKVRREMGRCSGCAFWSAQDRHHQQIGECHKHSPRPILKTLDEASGHSMGDCQDYYAFWPVTERDEFCGDYFPIELEVE